MPVNATETTDQLVAASVKEETPGAGCNRPEGKCPDSREEMRTAMMVRRPSDMRQRLSADWATFIDDDLERDLWIDHHMGIDPECLGDLADLERVTKDLHFEGLRPLDYDVNAIAVELRRLAGGQSLDTVADAAWLDLLKWHLRAPMPTGEVA